MMLADLIIMRARLALKRLRYGVFITRLKAAMATHRLRLSSKWRTSRRMGSICG